MEIRKYVVYLRDVKVLTFLLIGRTEKRRKDAKKEINAFLCEETPIYFAHIEQKKY